MNRKKLSKHRNNIKKIMFILTGKFINISTFENFNF